MKTLAVLSAGILASFLSASIAEAACTGSNGRGWGKGNGNGKFQMTQADKSCSIGFPNFINDKEKTSIPADRVSITRKPKSGDVRVARKGMVYTPKAGFKGKDKFCTRNTSPKVKGGVLAGCVNITVK